VNPASVPASPTPPAHPVPDGVTLRHFSSQHDYDACVALQDATWGAGFSERVPGAILQVSQKLGGVAAGAFDERETLLGFVFGMTGLYRGGLVHWSDMLAVRPDARGTGLGVRLKLFQRDAVRALGVHTMLWTADPLVARNAHLNINQLGAIPAEYIEDMYGSNTGSLLHGKMPTDRFVYRWDLDRSTSEPQSSSPTLARTPLTHTVLVNAHGEPSLAEWPLASARAPRIAIRVPHDLTALQSASPALALQWRMTVREATQRVLAAGYCAHTFLSSAHGDLPCYIFHAAP
jgi:chorismate synthase